MSNVSFVVREPIRIIVSTGVLLVDGARIGGLATHLSPNQRCMDGTGIWTVTHVSSGMRLGSQWGFVSEADALAFIKSLNALPLDWRDSRNLKRNPNMRDVFDSVANFCGGIIFSDAADGDAEVPS